MAGLSIAVFRDSEAVCTKGYGFADFEAGIPATADTKYDIASVSKLFTALAVMKLVEEGKLGLGDDLGTLLPAFPNPEQARRVTLRQLLNHTSGLRDYLPADIVRVQLSRKSPPPLSPSFVLDYLAERPLDFDPGKEWRYSEGVVPDARELFRIIENDGHLERIVLTGDTRTPLELIYKGDHSFGRADWPMDRFLFHVEDRRARGYSEYYNGIFATFNRRVKP